MTLRLRKVGFVLLLNKLYPFASIVDGYLRVASFSFSKLFLVSPIIRTGKLLDKFSQKLIKFR